ncbi:MAG: serine hydrolase [Acidobacteria bacterium]|nr:MAG: serine hydrolase [Acidobacteriota bacterium]
MTLQAKRVLKSVLVVAAVIVVVFLMAMGRRAQATGPEALEIDTLLHKAFKAGEPGGAVIVTRNGETVFRQGYGLADLELKVPIRPDMVFRLGSVTKQFSAVATLMLEEEGKLSVKDPITKYLPDYPTGGQAITVEHLLTHTSGIKSYTSIPEWRPLWRKDFTLTELIDLFKAQPMDFRPDERWLYNNSGYILLGAVIEKASGQSYEDFVEKKIFAPLGMKDSYYDRTDQIIPRRVKGYQRGLNGFQNAPYLSMTQPYAAGSLASTVDDLAIWDAALCNNKLIKKESLARAHSPHKLADGRSTAYGYGWSIGSYEGHRTIEHGGGIHGFATYILSMPEDHVYVAILTNGSAGPTVSPARLALQMAAIAIGKPVQNLRAITLPTGQLSRYTGVYSERENENHKITVEGNQLFWQPPRGPKSAIHPLSPKEFFIADSLNRIYFTLDDSGQAKALEFRPRVGMAVQATKTAAS